MKLQRITGTKFDLDYLWRLMRERESEKINISFRMPTWRQHVRFVLSKPYRAWYWVILVQEFYPVGYVSLTRRNEIGIVLFKEYRNLGIGPRAVKAIMAKHEPLPAIPGERVDHFLANINPNNAASIAMFKKLGSTLIQQTYLVPGE